MKKKIFLLVAFFIAIVLSLTGILYKNESEKHLKKVVVAEVTHSIFYTPWYVAIEKGYFEEEGLDVEIVLTPGADKTAAAVLSGDVNIGFSGPEAAIYVYNNKEEDHLITFAGLTKRDGQFLVGSCSEKENFKVENLKGKSVLAGRSGGMPLMIFNYALKEAGLNKKDVNIDRSVEFAALSGAFIGGQGDYVNLFEPTASKIEKQGYGCVLESLGVLSGEIPYTAYYAKKSYIEKNEDIIKSFVKALNKALKYIKDTDNNTLAKDIINQFPDTVVKEIESIIERYKEADSWWDNTYISKESYDRLQDVMFYNEVLDKIVDFDILVTNKYNEKYIRNK